MDTFIEEACLTKDEQNILRTRIACLTISEQDERFNISVCKINKIIKRLKWKYDNVQKYCKDLQLCKVSAAELYTDTHQDDTFQQFIIIYFVLKYKYVDINRRVKWY